MFHFVECLVEPWLCEVDIEFGHNFVAKIEEGLRDADLTVLFWSPEAARSDWTRLEWTSVIRPRDFRIADALRRRTTP